MWIYDELVKSSLGERVYGRLICSWFIKQHAQLGGVILKTLEVIRDFCEQGLRFKYIDII